MATAPPAAGTGSAYECLTAPTWAWMVAWPRVTVTVRGVTAVRYRGERLQATTTASENTVLAQLAAQGALVRVLAVAGTDGLASALTTAATRQRNDQKTADTLNFGITPGSTVTQLPVVRAGDTIIALLPS